MSLNKQLVQANCAFWKESLTSVEYASFSNYANLIQQSAVVYEGLVWQRAGQFLNDHEVVAVFNRPSIIFNMSVWANYGALKQFVYERVHGQALRQRGSWFSQDLTSSYVLWWVDAGHIPTLNEAKYKLDFIHKNGGSIEAFDFTNPYDALGNLISCESAGSVEMHI